MPRLAIIRSALLLLATMASTALGQGPSNFAGVWNNGPQVGGTQRTAGDKEGASGKGVATLTITQTASTLTISNGRLSSTYRLDGTETTNYIRVRQQPVPGKFRARWEGANLVVTGTFVIDGVERQEVKTLSLAPSGALVLNSVVTGNGQTLRVRSRYARRSNTTT